MEIAQHFPHFIRANGFLTNALLEVIAKRKVSFEHSKNIGYLEWHSPSQALIKSKDESLIQNEH